MQHGLIEAQEMIGRSGGGEEGNEEWETGRGDGNREGRWQQGGGDGKGGNEEVETWRGNREGDNGKGEMGWGNGKGEVQKVGGEEGARRGILQMDMMECLCGHRPQG